MSTVPILKIPASRGQCYEGVVMWVYGSRLEVGRMGGAVICSYANADAYDAVDLIDEHGGR